MYKCSFVSPIHNCRPIASCPHFPNCKVNSDTTSCEESKVGQEQTYDTEVQQIREEQVVQELEHVEPIIDLTVGDSHVHMAMGDTASVMAAKNQRLHGYYSYS